MPEQSPQPEEECPAKLTLAQDLFEAFLVCIGIGAISPLIPAFFLDFLREAPYFVFWGSFWGAFFGSLWGALTVIVVQIVGARYREAATLLMLAIQALSMIYFFWFLISIAHA